MTSESCTELAGKLQPFEGELFAQRLLAGLGIKVDRQLWRRLIRPSVGTTMNLGVMEATVSPLRSALPSASWAVGEASVGEFSLREALRARHSISASSEAIVLCDAFAGLRSSNRKFVDQDWHENQRSAALRKLLVP